MGDHGPLVIALHGLAESSRYWGSVLDLLASDHRVVVVDLLGFGRSPWPDLGYSAASQAGAVAESLRRGGLGDEPAVLLAHQAGATVAMHYALEHQSSVHAVVSLGTPWFRSPGEARRALRGPWWMSRWLVEHTDRARLLCRTVCGGRSRLVPRLARWFAPGEVPAEVIEDAFLHSWTSFSQTLTTCLVEASLPQLVGADFPVPMLALHGEDDTLVPVENLLDAAQSRPALTIERVAGAGHNLAWTAPGLVVAAVAATSRPRPLWRVSGVTAPTVRVGPTAPALRAARALPAIVATATEHPVGDAARMVRVSRRTVLTWVELGRVRARRQGQRLFIDRASLLEHAFGSDEAARYLLAMPWLSAAEAAARMGVAHATLARQVATGRLPSHRVAGRRVFLASELDGWSSRGSANEYPSRDPDV